MSRATWLLGVELVLLSLQGFQRRSLRNLFGFLLLNCLKRRSIRSYFGLGLSLGLELGSFIDVFKVALPLCNLQLQSRLLLR